MSDMSEYPWLATVIHDDGTHQHQRHRTREDADTWRHDQLGPTVTSHAIVHTATNDSDISID